MDLQDVSFQDEKVASDFWSKPVENGRKWSKTAENGRKRSKPVKTDQKSPFSSKNRFFDLRFRLYLAKKIFGSFWTKFD